MEQLHTRGLNCAGLLIMKSVCDDYDYLTVTMAGIYLYSLLWVLRLTCCWTLSATKIMNVRSYTYVHAAMVGCVMLCDVGSMFLVDSSLVQLFVSSIFSVLTTYVYSCHTSLTVIPLSVYVNAVMFAHCEHCIPYATQLCLCVCVCVCVCVCKATWGNSVNGITP